jgi:hypothetical protein
VANQAHSGLQGVPWHRCQRCGCDTRTSHLTWQLGLLLCSDHGCIDDLSINYRPSIINAALASGPDAPPAPILSEVNAQDLVEITF